MKLLIFSSLLLSFSSFGFVKKANIDDAFSVKYEEAPQEETQRALASSPVQEGEQQNVEKSERNPSEQDVDSATQLRYWKY
ncbi:MAG: hypothetical protein CME64_10370 [Halobacteriovoraceae bacterium]|nr:hypothetical protein [Halobacteriovoraceae bacterium]|tara:strand:- start:5511 stop:5753 length:243 start_codon:yes stop_codon:yes gene_type:complete